MPEDLDPHDADLRRSTRLLSVGILLLVAALAVLYLVDALRSGAERPTWLLDASGWALTLASRVLAPGGAILISVAVAIRARTTGTQYRTRRPQALTGIALLSLGLAQVTVGGQVLAALDLQLAPSGAPSASLALLVYQAVALTALPLGTALLCTLPLLQDPAVRRDPW